MRVGDSGAFVVRRWDDWAGSAAQSWLEIPEISIEALETVWLGEKLI